MLTPEQLANTPVEPPPPGETSNFVDPESKAGSVTAALVVVLALMTFVLGARLYGKIRIVKKMGLDDAASLAGGVSYFSISILYVQEERV